MKSRRLNIVYVGLLSLCAYSNGTDLSRMLEESILLLNNIEKHDLIYTPRVFNRELSYMLYSVPDNELVDLMRMAEQYDNDYLLNGIAASLVDRLPNIKIADVSPTLSKHSCDFIKKYLYIKSKRRITRACDGTERSIAEYVSEFDVPLEHIGNVGVLRFDNKNIDSLNGIQDLSYVDVGIATFANNCIVGSDLDPQFPNNAFQGLPNLGLLLLNENNINTVPGDFFSDTPQIMQINLANNGFISIPTGLFDNLSDLNIINFSNNLALATLSSTVFADATSLQSLRLNNNAIATIPSSLFANNSQMDTIDLSDNLLLTWPSAALDNLADLETLNLTNNLLISFNPNSLPDGSTIILTGNALTALQKSILESNFPEVSFIF